MDEVWQDVENTSGRYQISSLGNVRKQIEGNYVAIKPHFDSYGYLYVNIKYDGSQKNKHVAVHRLVASAFIKNPYNLPIVHHIDENKTNNSVTNLFWCTHGQNNSFSFSARKGAVVNNRVIEQYDMNGLLMATYPSFKAAADAIGVKSDSNQISKCCRGVQGRKSAYGFVWRFGVGDPMYKIPIDSVDKNHIWLFIRAYMKSPEKVVKMLFEILNEK